MTDWLRTQDDNNAAIAVERAVARLNKVWGDYWYERAQRAEEEADAWKHNYNTCRRVRQLLERELEEARNDLALARSASSAAAAGSPAGDAGSAKSNTPVKRTNGTSQGTVPDATGNSTPHVDFRPAGW